MNGTDKLILKTIIMIGSLVVVHFTFTNDTVLSEYIPILGWTFGMIAGYWIGAIDLDFGRNE